jgi:hypothetical protein
MMFTVEISMENTYQPYEFWHVGLIRLTEVLFCVQFVLLLYV